MLCACNTEEPQQTEKKFSRVSVLDQGKAVVMQPNGVVALPFNVYDYEAFTLSDYQVMLRYKGTTQSPTEVELLRVESHPERSSFSAHIADLATSDYYAIEVTLDFRAKSGVVISSNPFWLTTIDAAVTIDNFRFEKKHNPQLSTDIKMNYDNANRLTGSTPDWVESMELVASFESVGVVSVNGEVQTSGQSKIDFSKEVIYTVEANGVKAEYRVRVKNFTGLPIMFIDTADGAPITSKEIWKDARISLYGAGEWDNLEECDVEIRGRGNSTWGYDKKPYALKFPSKTSLLGMPKHKRWVLLANTMDRTMMRNRVAYHVAEQTSLAWTPRTEYVEVVLNGKHIGNYLLTEQIRIDSNRIDITEMEPSDNSGEAITGGYVYEMDFHFDNVNQWWTPQGFPSSIKFPDEDDITPEQIEWGKKYFNDVEGVLFGSNFKDPNKGYAAYLDVQSFVDYWLVYEICINHELANPGSVYLHKDRGGLLTAGPIWDFDWGTFGYNASPQAKGKLFMTHAIWYRRLFEDPAFKQLAKERWQALYPKFAALDDFILEQYDYLGESAKRNFAIWNPATTGNVNGDENLSFDDAFERLYDFYVDRIVTMNRIFSTW